MLNTFVHKITIPTIVYSILFLQPVIWIDHAYGNELYKNYYEKYEFVVCGQIIQKHPNGYIGIDGPKYTIKIESKYKDAEHKETFDAIGIHEDSNGPQRVLPLEVKERGIFFVTIIQDKYYSISNNYVKVLKCNSDSIPTPLGQYKLGAINKEIFCLNNNHSMIIKLSNDSPACVKEETKKILIERGWAEPT